MKIVILSGILFLLFVNISTQKTITCKVGLIWSDPSCIFSNVTIGPNETVTIKTDPEDADAETINFKHPQFIRCLAKSSQSFQI
jgi:hypothetical protein